MARYGYVRISKYEPTQEKQLEGVMLDQKIVEHVTAKQFIHEALNDLLDELEAGDELHVHSIDRLVVSVRGLHSIVTRLLEKDVSIHFHREELVFSSDMANEVMQTQLDLIRKLYQFMKNVTGERQREGMAIAKQKGAQIGRQKVLSDEQAEELRRRAELGNETKTELAKEFGISRKTLYVYLKN